jgi:hypothetical protein
MRKFKQYSVGKVRVHVWADSAQKAFAVHSDNGLDRRTRVYEWDAREDAAGIVVSNPRALEPADALKGNQP